MGNSTDLNWCFRRISAINSVSSLRVLIIAQLDFAEGKTLGDVKSPSGFANQKKAAMTRTQKHGQFKEESKKTVPNNTPPKINMTGWKIHLKMYLLLKLGIFQPVMLVFRGVGRIESFDCEKNLRLN